MGKRIKSTGVILDASSMASAPVSPAGTVALRAKSDATQFQYSANGGAWTDFGTGGGGGTVRLDQVLDPAMAAPQVKAFSMTDHSLVFSYTATQAEECFVITSTTPVTPGAAGSLLLLRADGATSEKNPLRVEARGVFVMTVNADGKVAMGRETGLANKLTVEHTNTGADETGGIQCNIFLASGNAATSTSTGVFTLTDNGNTSALTEVRVLNIALARTGTAVSNVPLFTYLIDARAYFSANTGVAYGIFLKPIVSNAAALTHWVGLHVETPTLLSGGVITNSKAIITAPGAGNVGIGTITPDAQLHVSGTVQVDQTTTQAITLYKYTDTADPFTIDMRRAHGSSSGTAGNIVSGDFVGRVLFEGRLGGTYTQLGYLQTRYDSTYIGVVELGAGASFSQSRVEVVETGSVGAVSLRANGGNYFQVQTSGFIFSHGGTGSLYFRDGLGWFTATSAPPAADRIAFWDSSAGVVTWLEAGSGLTISGTTMTASGSGITLGGNVLEVLYKSGTSSIGSIAVAGTTTYLKSNGAGVVPSFQTINASDIGSGTLALARGGTGASLSTPSSDQIFLYDWSQSTSAFVSIGTGLSLTGTYPNQVLTASGGPATPSGSLQYNNGGAFDDVLSSSVDGSGVVTFGSGSTIWKSDSSVLLSLRQYESTAANAPQLSVLRSRGSESSKSAVLAGDALFGLSVSGQYDSAGQRQGGYLGFTATGNYSTSSAPTVFRLKTTHLNQNFAMERLVIGGSKTLVDNTLTDLFTITFAAADQVGLGGEIHMMFVAKQVAGTVHTQVYRRVVSFIIGHNGATNTSMANFREEAGGQASAASNTTGFGGLSHAINADAAVSIGTNIPASPNLIATNIITYRILADSDLTTISQMTCYYHIIYHGEAEVTLS